MENKNKVSLFSGKKQALIGLCIVKKEEFMHAKMENKNVYCVRKGEQTL